MGRRGFKDCPSCNANNLAKSKRCHKCNHEFLIIKKELDYSKASRGKKQCGHCKSFIGVRSKFCPICKNEYSKPVENNKKKVEVPKKYKGGRIVLCPSGSCPYKLKSHSKEDVYEWCNMIFDFFKDTYTSDAIIYWLRLFFKIDTYEYKISKGYIKEWAEGLSPKEQEESLKILKNHDAIYAGKNSQYRTNFIKIRQ